MDYLDHLFDGIDDSIHLDKEQKEAILCEDDKVMVVAGAGSGKTTTMAAKIKYLVEQKNIPPNEILLISYTNKAVLELKERIQKEFHLDVEIMTFHKLGYEILKKLGFHGNILSHSDELLKQIFFNLLSHDENFQKKVFEYFLYESNYPKVKKITYWSLKGRLYQYQKKELKEFENYHLTLLKEVMFQKEEAEIANQLFFKNITYYYRKEYPFNHSYIPDFTIENNGKIYYLELFPQKESIKDWILLERKKRIIRKIHEKYQTTLLELELKGNYLSTFSALLKNHNISEKPKTKKEIFDAIQSLKQDMIYKELVKNVISYIHNYRINGCKKQKSNQKKQLFLEITKIIYENYQLKLIQNNWIDFEDMIQKSYERLKDNNPFHFQYIIVDEYQDISKKRYDFLVRLVTTNQSKLTVVGDDFQSIFSFAGSDISYFFQFQKGNTKVLNITNTYRNSQTLIEEAGKFVMKNKRQWKKNLHSDKKLENPIRVYYYKDPKKCFKKVLEQLVKEYGEDLNIVLLGRFHFDLKEYLNYPLLFLENGKLKSNTFPQITFTFLTVHASKGLGFPHVILLNAKQGIYGFPSLKDYPMELEDVMIKDDSYPFAEERRLFYVALTRTKNTVSILCPFDSVSPFVLELDHKKEYFLEKITSYQNPECPNCGYPLIRNYWNSKGIEPLYECVNHRKKCGFQTNHLKYRIPIQSCKKCQNGYLIVKENKESVLLQCTNCDNHFLIQKKT